MLVYGNQVLQNDALRLCLHYRLVDHVRIEQLHTEENLQSVEQRCIFQVLKLLFNYGKDVTHLKKTVRQTRAGAKITFDIPSRCSNTYLHSPLYKGAQIWNSLPENVQKVDSINQFVKHVKPIYAVFENLLDV